MPFDSRVSMNMFIPNAVGIPIFKNNYYANITYLYQSFTPIFYIHIPSGYATILYVAPQHYMPQNVTQYECI